MNPRPRATERGPAPSSSTWPSPPRGVPSTACPQDLFPLRIAQVCRQPQPLIPAPSDIGVYGLLARRGSRHLLGPHRDVPLDSRLRLYLARGVLSAGAFIVSCSWSDVGLLSGDRAGEGAASCGACSEFSTKGKADCAVATALLATPRLSACQRWPPSSAISERRREGATLLCKLCNTGNLE
jgi:hypothetical protein